MEMDMQMNNGHCVKDMDKHMSNGHGATENLPTENKTQAALQDDPKEIYCGIGSCRPKTLHRFSDIKMLTLVLTLWGVFRSIKDPYTTAVLTTVEKQFGFPSSLSGIIKNSDNIGYMIIVIFVNHFFRNSNKSKIFTCSIILTSLGLLLMALPQFLYGSSNFVVSQINTTVNQTISTEHELFCDFNRAASLHDTKCNKKQIFGSFNAGAFAIFIVAQLIIGMATSPSTLTLTYIDDNVSHKKTPAYLGFMFAGGRALSPLLGYALGAWTTSIYVDLSPKKMDRKDPRWLGAWWLGFLIIAVLSGIWAFPTILFPKGKRKKELEKQEENITANLKDLPKALRRILVSPVYPFLLLAICCSVFEVGFSTFLPKYMETQFGFSTSKTSIILGAILTISSVIGPIVSGLIMTKMKLSLSTLLKFVCVIAVINMGLKLSLMAFDCPKATWAGEVKHIALDSSAACNSNCSCSDSMFSPVCGSDNLNYISPCHAGCQRSNILTNSSGQDSKVYNNCSCIPNGHARSGICKANCLMAYGYVAVMATSMLCGMLCIIPIFSIILRSVSQNDKPLALAMASVPINLIVFVAPVVFGIVVDATCQYRANHCGKPGACMLYNRQALKYYLHIGSASLKLLTVVFYFIAWLGSRKLFISTETKIELSDLSDDTKKMSVNQYKQNVEMGNGYSTEKEPMLQQKVSVM